VIQPNELTSIMAVLANVFVTMVCNNLLLYMVYAFNKTKMVLCVVMVLSSQVNNVMISTQYLMMAVQIYVLYRLIIFVVFIQIEMVLLFAIITNNQK
jgi:hypothetical protein